MPRGKFYVFNIISKFCINPLVRSTKMYSERSSCNGRLVKIAVVITRELFSEQDCSRSLPIENIVHE